METQGAGMLSPAPVFGLGPLSNVSLLSRIPPRTTLPNLSPRPVPRRARSLAFVSVANASEGLFTIVCGAASFAILPRTPSTAWWLKPAERTALVGALARDSPLTEQREKLTLKACVSALTAPQVWFMFAQFFASGAMLYAMAYCEFPDTSRASRRSAGEARSSGWPQRVLEEVGADGSREFLC